MAEESRNTLKITTFILGAILLVCLIFLVYNYQQNKKVENYLKEEKADLVSQLDSIKVQYGDVLAGNDSLADSIRQKQADIEAMRKTISGLQADVGMLRKYKGAVVRLRRENKRLYELADSLKRTNSVLLVQRDSAQSQLQQQQQRTEKLEEQNLVLAEKVAKGAALSAQNIRAEGIRISNNGRISNTSRARRADKLRICFTIGKNNLADSGEKTIYAKVSTPENKLLGVRAGANEFAVGGKTDHFSAKTTVYYEGEPLDVCIFVASDPDAFVKGEYWVALYDDHGFIGETQLSLQ
ncbi:MAG: hypothetical protein V6Z82_00195 [Flavobacteriales bacterium]